MSNFFDSINIVKKIRRHFLLKESQNDTDNNHNNIIVIVISILIFVLISAGLIFIIFTKQKFMIKLIILSVLTICLIASIVGLILYLENNKNLITKVILVDDVNNKVKEWEIKGKPSALIGKNSDAVSVDIDLSNVKYSNTVSKVHAVLNYAAKNWYIEDLESSNGVGIKKISSNNVMKLQVNSRYKLEKGDIVFIAKVKLLIQ